MGPLARPGTDQEEVRALFSRPVYGLALLTYPASELACLDFDGPHAENLFEGTGIALPPTARTRTPSGEHRIYRIPRDAPRKPLRRIRLVAEPSPCGPDGKNCGVDLITNGFFIIPPTPGYAEEPDHPLEPGRIAIIPDELVALASDRVRGGGRATKGESDYARLLRGVCEGERHTASTVLIGHLLRCFKGDVEEVWSVMEPWCDRCTPPADKKKVRKTLEDLAAKDAAKKGRAGAAAEGPCPPHPYREMDGGICWERSTKHGIVLEPLTNFTARIVGDITEDDGAEERRTFEIGASLNGRVKRFPVPASRFTSMGWTTEHLGAEAIVYPGLGVRDHARCAVQLLSGQVPRRTVFSHLGWRRIGETWAYLHGGGAIGPDGAVPGVDVGLREPLVRFALPDPPMGAELARAVRASLEVLDVAPDTVTVPLLAAVYRAALGRTDFSIHLSGQTGVGKTELAALAQQHIGPGLDARHLPGSWASTGNALEALAFAAKDTLLVVDDFAPAGATADVQRLHREADRLLRAQGNSAGRQRMRADVTLRPPKPPRGMILSTGEDVPRGQSLRARLLVLELAPGALDWQRLTSCQEGAAAGLYARALAGFVRWLAPRYERVREHVRARVEDLRQTALRSDQHRRTPDIIANLAVGLEYFLAFAQEAGALTADEAGALWTRAWEALGAVAGAQAHHQGAVEPTRRFLELLAAAVASGRAHVAGPDGHGPRMPWAWGWRSATVGVGDDRRIEWRPGGDRVGWVEEAALYLEPEAAYAAAQRLGRDGGEGLAVTLPTLKRRLRERELLVSTDAARGVLTVRRTLEGKRREVLHLHADALGPLPVQGPDQPDQGG